MRGLFAIGLFQLLAWTSIHAADPPPIPIVHTWGDLQNAPKFTTFPVNDMDATKIKPGNDIVTSLNNTNHSGKWHASTEPVTFQIGISSDQVDSGSALLLYFLGQTGSNNPYSPMQWGVYWLRVDGELHEDNTAFLTFQPADRPAGTLFYTQVVSLTSLLASDTPGHIHPEPPIEAGDHVVELIKPFDPNVQPAPAPQVIVRATIHVRKAPENYWYPLWLTQAESNGAYSGTNSDGQRFAIEAMQNPRGCAAVPGTPSPRWYTTFPARDQALPQLVSNDPPGTQVQLQMTDTTLVATFASKIQGFFPDDYFLTRWWVNGKPAPLDPEAEAPGQMRAIGSAEPESVFQTVAWHGWDRLPLLQAGMPVWYTNEVHFHLDFKPDRLGAKAGDRIGVQCLFCPRGFVKLYRGSMPLMDFMDESRATNSTFTLTGFSELSNRVDFTYSGDPKHPAR